MTWRRAIVAVLLGLALGVSIGWLDRELPAPLGAALVLALCAGLIWFCVRHLRWARQMKRELDDLRRDLER